MNMKCMNDQSIQFIMFTLVETSFVLFLFLVHFFTVFSIKSLIYLKRVNKTKHKEKIDKNDCCNSQSYIKQSNTQTCSMQLEWKEVRIDFCCCWWSWSLLDNFLSLKLIWSKKPSSVYEKIRLSFQSSFYFYFVFIIFILHTSLLLHVFLFIYCCSVIRMSRLHEAITFLILSLSVFVWFKISWIKRMVVVVGHKFIVCML